MGCGSSGQVVPSHDDMANGHDKTTNGTKSVANGHHDKDHDDVPTVVLPETPAKPPPPVAFEIPLEEFDVPRRDDSVPPPPHVQRLLQPPQAEVSLPGIQEKLAEAEQRRQQILQQRAASAQKRALKMMKSFQEMDQVESEHESLDTNKHANNNVTIPPEPGVVEDKNI